MGQRTYNGVAILARTEPHPTRTTLPGDPADAQSRYVEAAVSGILVTSIYAPNGNPQPGPKFDYKLAWMKRLLAHARTLFALDAPAVLAGDFNVVPTERDIYRSRSWLKDALLQPAPRALFRRLLDQGWIDAVQRLRHEAEKETDADAKRDLLVARHRAKQRSLQRERGRPRVHKLGVSTPAGAAGPSSDLRPPSSA